MKFKPTLCAWLITGGLTMSWETAQAGSVASQLFVGQQDLIDSSAEIIVNHAGAANILDVGDELVGVLTIGRVQQGANTNFLGAPLPITK